MTPELRRVAADMTVDIDVAAVNRILQFRHLRNTPTMRAAKMRALARHVHLEVLESHLEVARPATVKTKTETETKTSSSVHRLGECPSCEAGHHPPTCLCRTCRATRPRIVTGRVP